jgi:Phage ABA sandwich domain
MTQVAELVAGRELDALVAEKVMGWHVWHDEFHDAWHCNDPATAARGSHVPSYSTDIAAAWQVVEQIAGTNAVSISTQYLPFRWQAVLAGKTASAPTAPLAICRAALAAVTPTLV